MSKALCWAVILPCVVAASAWGAVGDLKPIPLDRRTLAAAGIQTQSLRARTVVAAAKGCGTVHPKAMVATVTAGRSKIMVALDSAKADAKHPDLVRFDFSGKGEFKGAPTVPLKRGMDPRAMRYFGAMPAGEYYHFGPATLKVPRGRATIPVSVRGQYYVGTGRTITRYSTAIRPTTARYLSLTLITAAQGSCRFGGKVCGVRVVDGTSNLRLGDGLGMTQKDGQVVHQGRYRGLVGDAVLIDAASATFRKATVKVFCGQLARVDGGWYRLGVSEDGSKIAATHEPGTGKVVVPGDTWSVTLIGTRNVLKLSGRTGPVDVPVDQYVAAGYQGTFNSDVPSKPHRIRSGSYVMSGREKGKVFDVKDGAVTKITVGSPLTATVAVSQSKGTVQFSGRVQDASGARVSSLYGPKGRPPAPTVTVYNDKREKIYTTTLKYG